MSSIESLDALLTILSAVSAHRKLDLVGGIASQASTIAVTIARKREGFRALFRVGRGRLPFQSFDPTVSREIARRAWF